MLANCSYNVEKCQQKYVQKLALSVSTFYNFIMFRYLADLSSSIWREKNGNRVLNFDKEVFRKKVILDIFDVILIDKCHV